MKKTLIFFILFAVAALVTGIYNLTQQADINYYRARRLFISGAYREAIPFYEKTLEIDPVNGRAVRELAYSYLWTERPGEAASLFREALRSDPTDQKLLVSLADAYSWSNELDRAVSLLKALIQNKADPDLEKKLAEIYLWRGDSDEAVKLLEPLEVLYPRDPQVLWLYGKSLYYSGKSREASEVLERLMEVMDEK